ncbi:MAG: HAD-IB family hydrolase [Deltaproteobacteria bacterium]|jgi:HAD superfamily hydrolase (TIGR01490 family)
MNRVVAIFDVDQTLVQGNTERVFFRYLVRRGQISVAQALAFLGQLARRPQDRFEDKSYLAGLEVAEVARLAARCYQEEIAPRVSPEGLACLLEHQTRGHAVALLSGSLALLLNPLKEELGADWLIATELQRIEGRFTGEIAGLHPRGTNKLCLLQELSHNHGFDLSSSYAYGDHIQDAHILRSIGHPVAVNPSWRLRLKAHKHRWPIRYF